MDGHGEAGGPLRAVRRVGRSVGVPTRRPVSAGLGLADSLRCAMAHAVEQQRATGEAGRPTRDGSRRDAPMGAPPDDVANT